MFSARKLGGGPKGRGFAALAHYYDESQPERPDKAMDEYFVADQDSRVPAQWWCPAGQLQTDGAAIAPGELKQAMDGFGRDGTKLVQDAARNTRVAGWDMQLSVPKALSCIWAISDPETRREIVGDIIATARETFAEMHRSGAFITRRGKGGRIHEPAKDVAIAIVPHATSRAADPHIHLHCVLVNSCIRNDETTGAIHSPGAFKANKDGAVTRRFLDGLARRLEDRGMTITQRTAHGWHIEGVPKELVRQWSSRRQTILAEVEKARVPAMTPKGQGQQRARIARETRKAKTTIPVGPALEARWKQQMKQWGIDPRRVWQRVMEGAALVRRQVVSLGYAAVEKLKQANVLRMRQ